MLCLRSRSGNCRGTARWPREWRWWLSGAFLVAAHVVLLYISARFGQEHPLIERPVLLLVGLELLAGVAWLAAVWPPPGAPRAGLMPAVIAVGVVLRGLMLFSTPMLEDDFHRYLWDGAVVTHGLNPYTHAPAEFLDADNAAPRADTAVFAPLARDGAATLRRINHPSLRTVYPPVAQGAFALAHWIGPWSLIAWRAVLLVFDAATLVLLLSILRCLALPQTWAAVYWWNPLFLLHGINGAHMDALVFPFVLGCILLAVRGRHLRAAACCTLAVGVKLWPLLLLPFLLRPLAARPRRLAAGLAIVAGIAALVVWPAAGGLGGGDSGFGAYAKSWEMNDALFMALLWAVRAAAGWVGNPGAAPLLARGLVVGLLGAWIAWLAGRKASSGRELADRILLAVAALFLLSPTQFPWYSLWALPILALSPRLSLMWLMVLQSLYHLRFYFDARERVAIFDNGLVWLEYIPVLVLLAWESLRAARRAPGAGISIGMEAREVRP